LAVAALLLWCRTTLLARPITARQAEKAAAGWLKPGAQPLCTPLSRHILRSETFIDASGQALYHIVYMEGGGFAIVSGDDLVEPIIGFSDADSYDPSPENPLGALVSRDMAGRLAAIRGGGPQRAESRRPARPEPRSKWRMLALAAEDSDDSFALMDAGSIPDVRVPPLLQTKWAQRDVCGEPCYNYYTPDHARTGCVATAMAQIMRYHEHPQQGVGQQPFWISAPDGTSFWAFTRGGNGYGSPYKWSEMVFVPNCEITQNQRAAIGSLCYDAGISIVTSYGDDSSQANTLEAKDALIDTFGYAHAVKGYNAGSNIGPGLIAMINPNLDAKAPVILGITGAGGHAVVCDGYGYDSSTLYHHLNMGWSGLYDAWYNLPDIDSNPQYSSVYKCVYNISATADGDGEVVSGRVLAPDCKPVAGAIVYAGLPGRGASISAESDDKGIYALGGLDSATTYQIVPMADGLLFYPLTATTGTSRDRTAQPGNIWGLDFQGEVLEITSITPAEGPTNSCVKMQGLNFGTSRGSVLFGGDYQGDVIQWTDTTICCRVPEGAYSGAVRIRTAEDAQSTGIYFSVTDPDLIWVDIAACTPGTENGTTQFPFGSIQDAIYAATEADTVAVRPGLYFENIHFRGRNITVTGLNLRDHDVVASTVIDGDRAGAVVTFENAEDANCVLAGLTICNGMSPEGGGIRCINSSPTIIHCTITENLDSDNGGGMHSSLGSPTVVNCNFVANSARQRGGAVFNLAADTTLVNCTFTANLAGGDGGAVANLGASPLIANCTFGTNSADDDGGAIYNRDAAQPTMVNCTLSGNFAAHLGAAIYNSSTSGLLTITNSIFWANADSAGNGQSSQIYGGTPSVNYSCIQGLTGSIGGTGNIGENPCFLRGPEEPTPTGHSAAIADFTNLRLSPFSPCIDAADNNSLPPDTADLDIDQRTSEPIPLDLDGRPRVLDDPLTAGSGNGPIVDMGAYELGSLLAHWRLDEAEGDTAEDSAGENDGLLHGDPEWQPAAGRRAGALLFDGQDDYIDCGNSPVFDLSEAITVAAWVKIGTVKNDWQTIIAKGDSAWRLSTVQSDYRFHFAVTGSPAWHCVDAETEIEPAEWHHVCGTYDGACIRIFIDGIEDPASPVPYTAGITVGEHNVRIGENQEKPDRNWDGMIDDVRVYNYALAAREVAHLPCIEPLSADLNHDCSVDMSDYALLTSAWLTRPGDSSWNSRCDIAAPPDDTVDMLDLTVLIHQWLAGAD
jgi:hypothetical protein